MIFSHVFLSFALQACLLGGSEMALPTRLLRVLPIPLELQPMYWLMFLTDGHICRSRCLTVDYYVLHGICLRFADLPCIPSTARGEFRGLS
jgi:hypothetical protein